MKLRQTLLAVSFAISLVRIAAAQSNSGTPPSPSAETPPSDNVFNPKTTPADPAPSIAEESAKPKRARAVSNDVAASISSTLPKYNPPPKPVEAKPDEEKPDLRETDKPRNGIIRLPSYVTRGQRSPVFRENQIYTKSGLAALAVKRYISDSDRALNSFTLPLFGSSLEDRAMVSYRDNERLQNIAELNDDARTVSKSDPAEGAYIKRVSQDTFMRRSDFGWNGSPGDANR